MRSAVEPVEELSLFSAEDVFVSFGKTAVRFALKENVDSRLTEVVELISYSFTRLQKRHK